AMELVCPKCQKKLTIPEQYAGQLMRCPLCQGFFNVPAASPTSTGGTAPHQAINQPAPTALEKRKILIQLDSDPHPSVFDRVVAIDAGADEVFSYGSVKPEQVRELVHGAIFTRGPDDLKRTVIFIGGSDVTAGEKLLVEARKHMIPAARLSVSV